jgi:hypothetical protein
MANSLNLDLEGKTVLLKKEFFKPQFQEESQRIVKVLGGFGAKKDTMGTALYVKFLCDGEETRFEGYQIEKIIE